MKHETQVKKDESDYRRPCKRHPVVQRVTAANRETWLTQHEIRELRVLVRVDAQVDLVGQLAKPAKIDLMPPVTRVDYADDPVNGCVDDFFHGVSREGLTNVGEPEAECGTDDVIVHWV